MTTVPETNTIYLDYAATTPLSPKVRDAMQPYLLDFYGNPSSMHTVGRKAKTALDDARQRIANCLNAKASEITLTASGTESDNLAILGVGKAREGYGKHIVTTCIEHSAVENSCKALERDGWTLTYLPVDKEGFVSAEDLQKAIGLDTTLVSIIHGHNEIGTIQDIQTLSAVVKKQAKEKGIEIAFHTDAVQTVGKLPIDLSQWPDIDYLTFTAHKFYGPKGIGGLFIREGSALPKPLVYGGGQEDNLRSGTENLAGMVGMANALELAYKTMTTESQRLKALQETFIKQVQTTFMDSPITAELNGPVDSQHRVPGTVHFSFAGPHGQPIEGETIVLKLDLHGICVSSGSACHSAVIEPSRIIKALGKSDELARGTVRFSLGKHTTQAQLGIVVEKLSKILNKSVASVNR